MKQEIIAGADALGGLKRILGSHKLFVVCDPFLPQTPFFSAVSQLNPTAVFSGFAPNPLYEDVAQAVELFRQSQCDTVLAVGGGSAIDVAKCVKLYSGMDWTRLYFEQPYRDNGTRLIAVPTTAGTGSESTRFAVIYYQGKKMSIFHDSILPQYAVLDPAVLSTLPLYQKKCTLLDALCQAIESRWSVNATAESAVHSQRAVRTILADMSDYLERYDQAVGLRILRAANEAGQAINLTQTTAPHAMSYKLTSLYRIPHGHAVAICLPFVWEYMLDAIEGSAEPRLQELEKTFAEIAEWMNCKSPREAVGFFLNLLAGLGITVPDIPEEHLRLLADSVNPERLRNTPLPLDRDAVYTVYARMNVYGKKIRAKVE